MSKKISCLLIALCLSFTMSGLVQAKERISSDTIITEDNINEVLEYIGIDPTSFIKTDENQFGVKTVEELEQALAQAKTMPKEITAEIIEPINNINSVGENNYVTNLLSGSVTCLYRLDCDSYTVDFTCAASYQGYYWTSVSNPNATADTDSLTYVFKVEDPDLVAIINSSRKIILMEGTIRVDHYVGVAGYGLIKIGYQVINSINSWDVNDYAY